MSLQEGGDEGKQPQSARARAKGSKAASTSRKEIVARINAATVFFKRPEVADAMREAAKKAHEWLAANRSSYDERALVPDDPWWPLLAKADDPILLDSRKVLLRSKCFENGLRAFCSALADQGIGYVVDYDCLAFAAEHQAIAVHHQLLAFTRTRKEDIDLAELARRFDYKNPTNLRNARLSQMVKLGLWSSRVGKQEHEGFAISLGPAAFIFHTDAFYPTYTEFKTNHLGRKIK